MSESETQVDLLVGSLLVTDPEGDPAARDEEREWIEAVQGLLREEGGLDVDLLARPGEEAWSGSIPDFSDLYELKRLAAHSEHGGDLRAVLTSPVAVEEEDNLLAEILDDQHSTRYPHLIRHRGPGGFYIPGEFNQPIWIEAVEDEDEGDEDEEGDGVTSFGSSTVLLRELEELEGRLREAGALEGGTGAALQALREGARRSVESGLPLALW